MEYRPQAGVWVSLSGDDEADLRGYWERLSEGGTVTDAVRGGALGSHVWHVRRPVRHRWMVNAAGQPN